MQQVPIVPTLAFACLVLLSFIATTTAQSRLGPYNVNINTTTLSGLSAGGYFTVQMHVAWSANFKGAAVFAGGPYNCAQGEMSRATGPCMEARTTPSLQDSIRVTNNYASTGKIDPVSNLNDAKVYLFAGTQDTKVKPIVTKVLNDYYHNYVKQGNVVFVNTLPAAHTMPTDATGLNPCGQSYNPYISSCNYDGAGQALQTLYDNKLKPKTIGALGGAFIEFDQTEFLSGKSFGTTGFMYVPKPCASGASCGTVADIQDKWVKLAGYNSWADSNNIIVLYPQVIKATNPFNPNGCWDWWGYNNKQNYDTKTGDQMRAVKGMIDRIASGVVTVPSPSNLAVAGTTDNTVSLTWNTVTGGAGYNVYRNGVRVNPTPVTTARFTDSGLDSGSSYEYSVSTVTAAGAESSPSSTVTATTTGNPPPVQPPSDVTVGTTTSSSVTLSWTAVSRASDYNIYRNGVLVPASPIGSPQFTDTGLQAETTYTYQVSSLTEVGVESSKTVPVSATTKPSWTCKSFTTSNYAHVQDGRAYNDGGYAYAKGSDDYMGLYNLQTSTLAETAMGFFIVGAC